MGWPDRSETLTEAFRKRIKENMENLPAGVEALEKFAKARMQTMRSTQIPKDLDLFGKVFEALDLDKPFSAAKRVK
jgi:hypothetical protein